MHVKNSAYTFNPNKVALIPLMGSVVRMEALISKIILKYYQTLNQDLLISN